MDNNRHAMDSITWSEFVDEMEVRAVHEVLLWARRLKNWPQDLTKIVHGEWILENMGDLLTNAQIWDLAQQNPGPAIWRCHEYLSNEQIAKISEIQPMAVLECCPNRLPSDRLWEIARQYSWLALSRCHGLFTDDMVFLMACEYPELALKCCSQRFSQDQINQLEAML